MISRIMRIVIAAILIQAAAGGPATDVCAQDPLELEDATVPALRDWGLAVTPYGWLAAQSSDVGGTALRQSFNDLASITNFGFQGKLLARWRWVRFTGDFTYARMKSQTEIFRTSVDLSIDQYIVDVKIGGAVYDSRTPAQDGGLVVWASAGARYWDNRVDVTSTRQPVLPGQDPIVDTEKTAQNWWDPVLSLAMHFPVTPKVGFFVRATGGGFGIGEASSYLWDAEFLSLFRLSNRFLISAGYRQFKYDRTDGEGDGEIRQTVTVTGPVVGVSIGLL